jgi:hypothetical protein
MYPVAVSHVTHRPCYSAASPHGLHPGPLHLTHQSNCYDSIYMFSGPDGLPPVLCTWARMPCISHIAISYFGFEQTAAALYFNTSAGV